MADIERGVSLVMWIRANGGTYCTVHGLGYCFGSFGCTFPDLSQYLAEAIAREEAAA
jgi:hypothetical protein